MVTNVTVQVFCAARAAVADAWKMDESAILAVREGGALVTVSAGGVSWGWMDRDGWHRGLVSEISLIFVKIRTVLCHITIYHYLMILDYFGRLGCTR